MSKPRVRIVGEDALFVAKVQTALEASEIDVDTNPDTVVDLVCDLSAGRGDTEDRQGFQLHARVAQNATQALAGVQAMLRRSCGYSMALRLRRGVLKFEEYTFSSITGDVAMSTLEVKLIQYLLEQGGRPVPRDELLVEVWGYRAGMATRAIDQTVNRIRAKIERDRANPEHLKTIRGQGYCFEVLRDVSLHNGDVSARLEDSRTLHNLPRRLDRCFGREDELASLIISLQTRKRLLSLHGEAGVGKSRLVVELGRRVIQDLPEYDAVLLIDFSEATTEEQTFLAVANQIQLLPDAGSGKAWRERAIRSLNRYERPLILGDQCEQALPASSHVISELLARCPALRVVVATREPLQVRGEQIVPVSSLSVSAALDLFHDRVSVQLGCLPADQLQQTTHLIHRLEGNPLAIELAATRMTVMSPFDLFERLDSPLKVLRRHRTDEGRRHDSMREALEVSWQRLSVDEQAVLMQCSALVEPFSLKEAEEHVRVFGSGQWEVAHHVHALVQRSLIRVQRSETQPHRQLRMSSFVRAFALDKWAARSEDIAPHTDEVLAPSSLDMPAW